MRGLELPRGSELAPRTLRTAPGPSSRSPIKLLPASPPVRRRARLLSPCPTCGPHCQGRSPPRPHGASPRPTPPRLSPSPAAARWSGRLSGASPRTLEPAVSPRRSPSGPQDWGKAALRPRISRVVRILCGIACISQGAPSSVLQSNDARSGLHSGAPAEPAAGSKHQDALWPWDTGGASPGSWGPEGNRTSRVAGL